MTFPRKTSWFGIQRTSCTIICVITERATVLFLNLSRALGIKTTADCTRKVGYSLVVFRNSPIRGVQCYCGMYIQLEGRTFTFRQFTYKCNATEILLRTVADKQNLRSIFVLNRRAEIAKHTDNQRESSVNDRLMHMPCARVASILNDTSSEMLSFRKLYDRSRWCSWS